MKNEFKTYYFVDGPTEHLFNMIVSLLEGKNATKSESLLWACNTNIYIIGESIVVGTPSQDYKKGDFLADMKGEMDFNGYAWFDSEAFAEKSNKCCYIPENAESVEDMYNYHSMRELVHEWAKENPEYLNEHETDVDAILVRMFEDIEWMSPSTWLNNLNSF